MWKHVGQLWQQPSRSWKAGGRLGGADFCLRVDTMPYTMVIGVFAQVLTLLVSSNLLVACEPDTQLKIGPAHEDSQAARHVRSTSDGSTDYEEYGDRLVEQEDHVKPGLRKVGRKTKNFVRQKLGRSGKFDKIENSPLLCFRICNSLIFEVYQLLGGNICNCDK